jgi:hypothetical protein
MDYGADDCSRKRSSTRIDPDLLQTRKDLSGSSISIVKMDEVIEINRNKNQG